MSSTSLRMMAAILLVSATPVIAEPAKPAGQAVAAASTAATDQTAPGAAKPIAPAAVAPSGAAPADSAPASTGETKAATPPPAEAAKPAPPPVPVTLKASINLSTQTMTVSENGQIVHSWKISSGTRGNATPRGTYTPKWTARMWNSRQYHWAPMPYSVFIHGGVAVHGTSYTGYLGRPASKGCIRLATGNAKTFYNLVHRHGMKATRVSIHGAPNFASQAVASASPRSPRRVVRQESYGGFWSGFGGSYSAYDEGFTKPARRVKPKTRIVRLPNGKKRRVVVQSPPPSYYDDYAYSGW
jgi:lipoprotein-anchoring transpeptidase ErfK/SrfK